MSLAGPNLDAGPFEEHLESMKQALPMRISAGPGGYATALLMVVVSTIVGMLMASRWGSSAVDITYLPAVLAAAVVGGSGPAVTAAIASALAYNYFFTAPYHTFRIHSPADIVTVMVLFLVALVTSHLAAGIRKQAHFAQAHAARNAIIAGLARRLLSCSSEQEIANIATRDLAELFDCNTVLLTGQPEPRVIAAEPPTLILTPSDLAAAAMVLAGGHATGRGVSPATTVEWQFHPVGSETQTIAAGGLARDDGVPPVTEERLPLLNSLLDQIALALERARLEREARNFAALREQDRIRSALLTSIGQDLAPPLAEIAKAVGELRRSASPDKSVVFRIGSEATKLQRYISNLVDLDLAADQQLVEVGGVKIDIFHREVWKDGQEVHLTPKEYALLAELAKHPGRVLTHAHLLKTVWGPAQATQTEYLRVAVRALRQKLERNSARPAIIINEPAVGYRLAVR